MSNKPASNHIKLTKELRSHQGLTPPTSSHISIYDSTMVLSLDYHNNIQLIKNRYGQNIKDMSTDESVDIMMDMLCRMVFRGRMELFQEGMKQNLCEAVKETLKGGDLNEDTL